MGGHSLVEMCHSRPNEPGEALEVEDHHSLLGSIEEIEIFRSPETGRILRVVVDGELLVPQNAQGESPIAANSALKDFGHGDLKRELEALIRTEVPLEEGETAPSEKSRRLTSLLVSAGWAANFESVRATLRRMGYYKERKT
jgi:hypothetical protein